MARLNQLLFKLVPVKRRRHPSLPHHRLVMVKFLLLAYRQVESDGEAISLYPLLDRLGAEPRLAKSFGFANGVPSERWVVLTHRKLVDNWDVLQAVLPWQVCKPSRVLDMHSDRSSLIARVKKLKAYGLEDAVKRMFPGAGKGPDPYDRLPIVLVLLASYDPDGKGVVNMTALVEALHEDASLREICGFTDLVPSRPTFVRTLEILEQDGNWPILQEIKHHAVDDRRTGDPEFGRCVAVDSTVIPAYCNPNRRTARYGAEGCDPATCQWCRKCRGDPDRCACARSDPEASWIKKYDARAAKGYIWVWGYKYHMLVDVETGDEIVGILTNDRTGDSPILRELFLLAEATFPWFAPELLLADRGYDSRKNVQFLNDRGVHTVIPKRELARIHRRETVAAVRGGMRDQGSGRRGPDADEMDDVGRGCRSKEMLTTRSSGAGSDFQRRSPAEAIRSRWRGWARQLGNLVDRSDAAGVVKKGVAVRAVWPGRC